MSSIDSVGSQLNKLTATVDKVLSMVQSLTSKRDDQNILMTSMAGQMQVQGERLRQIEDDLDAMKSQMTEHFVQETKVSLHAHKNISDQTNMQAEEKLDLTAVKDMLRKEIENALNMEYVKNELQFSIKQMTVDISLQMNEELERIIKDNHIKCTELDDSVSALRSSLEDQKIITTDIQTLNSCINDKVFRLTAIVGHATTQLNEELALNRTETHAMAGIQDNMNLVINKKLDTIENEIKKQTVDVSKVRNGLNHNLSQKIDILNKSTNKIENGLNKNLVQKIDSFTELQNKQNENVEKMRREMTSQKHSLVDQIIAEGRITRNVITKTPQTGLSYKCDFHIVDFEDFVGTERICFSQVWYIDQLDMHFKAKATFDLHNNVTFSFLFGYFPTVCGIQSKEGYAKISLEVAVMDQNNTESGNTWKLNGQEWEFVYNNSLHPKCDGWVHSCGWAILPTVSCDEIKKKGLLFRNKALIRFDLKVLKDQ